jgi:hypothetical protein
MNPDSKPYAPHVVVGALVSVLLVPVVPQEDAARHCVGHQGAEQTRDEAVHSTAGRRVHGSSSC